MQPSHGLLPQYLTANGASVQSLGSSNSQANAPNANCWLPAVRRSDDWDDAVASAVDEFSWILSCSSSPSGSKDSTRRFQCRQVPAEEGTMKVSVSPASNCLASWSKAAPAEKGSTEASSASTGFPDSGDASFSLSGADSWSSSSASTDCVDWGDSPFSLSRPDCWSYSVLSSTSRSLKRRHWSYCQSCRYMGSAGACRRGYKNPVCFTKCGYPTSQRLQIRNLARMIHIAPGTPMSKRSAAADLAVITNGDERLSAYAVTVCTRLEARAVGTRLEAWAIPQEAEPAGLRQPLAASQNRSLFPDYPWGEPGCLESL